jgi:hypothetical protein
MQLVVGGPITTKMPMEAAAEVAVAVETETREVVRDAHSEEDEVGEVLVILEEEEGEEERETERRSRSERKSATGDDACDYATSRLMRERKVSQEVQADDEAATAALVVSILLLSL